MPLFLHVCLFFVSSQSRSYNIEEEVQEETGVCFACEILTMLSFTHDTPTSCANIDYQTFFAEYAQILLSVYTLCLVYALHAHIMLDTLTHS